MKKRSLFVATAMLLVAVIACTSATYAWFITSNDASVGQIQVSVQAQGGIQISLDNSTWKSTITVDEIKAATAQNYTVPDSFILKDFRASTGTFYNGTINASSNLDVTAPTLTGTDADGIVSFTIYVRTTDYGKFKFGPSTAMSSSGGYVYSAYKVGSGNFTVVSGKGTADTYKAFTGAASNLPIAASMTVETGAAMETVTSATGFDKTTEYDVPTDGSGTAVQVYMWAEGQDPDCNGSVNDAGTLTLAFTKAVATP